MTKRKNAFTLAEMLITLSVIGIIAVLTVPGLITQYQKKVTAVKVKKAYAELNQAIQLSQVANGSMKFWDLGENSSIENTRAVVAKYIAPYFNSLKEHSSGGEFDFGMPVSRFGVNYMLNNVGVSFYAPGQSKVIFATISVVSKKKQDYISGRDWFYFLILPDKIVPYGYVDNITRDEIIAGYTYKYLAYIKNGKSVYQESTVECSNAKRYGCTMLWYLDGFEFKADYPW